MEFLTSNDFMALENVQSGISNMDYTSFNYGSDTCWGCEGGCEGDCKGGCQDSCYGGCSGNCGDNCGGCSGSCDNCAR